MSEQLVGSGTASRILERSLTTLYQLEKSGKLPTIRTVEGQRLYRLEDVNRLAGELKRNGKRS
ncbi:MAG TPA: MerR family transcriptional regulator [Acidobacteriota bacterium]|nr:MerR family transcriptional regulator [Acidobacteriota bacterium]